MNTKKNCFYTSHETFSNWSELLPKFYTIKTQSLPSHPGGNSSQKFFKYEFNTKTSANKVPQNIKKELNLTPYQNYKVDPIEKNIFKTLNFTRFSNLSQFCNYLIYSNDLPLTQLIFTIQADLKNLPNIKHLIQLNNFILPSEDCSNQSGGLEDLFPIARSLQTLYDPYFWNKLMLLYFAKFHPLWPYINLKTFNPLFTSPSLLNIIYFAGYQFYSHKSPELTSYMESAVELALKQIYLKPCKNHLQALLILGNLYQFRGDMKLARACQANLTRMMYLMGIQIENCSKFNWETKLERKLLHRRVAIANFNVGGNLEVFPAYLVEVPKLDSALYHNLYSFKSNTTNEGYLPFVEGLNTMEFYLTLKLSQLTHVFCDISLVSSQLIPTKNISIMEKQLARNLELLNAGIKAYEDSADELKKEFPEFEGMISRCAMEIRLSYFDCSLNLLNSFLSINPPSSNEIATKILAVCHSMAPIILNEQLEFDQIFNYYGYMVCFQYLKLIKNYKFNTETTRNLT
ncbi:hypothetical protein CONCODRAFT_10613 [Conidiobolus coronatus NRRL 28638]|uniref:Xylanolytic transcriptional activator regulatory domain-containing protein n=1 Tax=Conidiobolus coronatus (strain ATCC 28846 / CBS 209.66 / NRRL 28638) TaxID=796925 RepID=A0A137NWW7_CONC2|nr:hypothetical protein CONCODRAFT_10613 [Conidiobolus coronatus NRRL 28638]|eukprot:KXN67335.1 hypothetical protein CONCODRAFT_10613 [Conidiobolus coronatus NRRL 28638]